MIWYDVSTRQPRAMNEHIGIGRVVRLDESIALVAEVKLDCSSLGSHGPDNSRPTRYETPS